MFKFNEILRTVLSVEEEYVFRGLMQCCEPDERFNGLEHLYDGAHTEKLRSVLHEALYKIRPYSSTLQQRGRAQLEFIDSKGGPGLLGGYVAFQLLVAGAFDGITVARELCEIIVKCKDALNNEQRSDVVYQLTLLQMGIIDETIAGFINRTIADLLVGKSSDS